MVEMGLESDDPRFPAMSTRPSGRPGHFILFDERRWAAGERISYQFFRPGQEANGALVVSRRTATDKADMFVATGLCTTMPLEKSR